MDAAPAAPTAAAPVRRRLRPAERRDQLVGVAREVFSELGADGATVRDVAERAGVTLTLVYRYFSSKDEIYQAAVLDPLEAHLAELTTSTHELAASSDIPRSQVLERFHELFLGHVLEMAPLIAAVLFSDSVEGPQFYRRVLLPKVRDVVTQVIVDVSGWPAESLDVDLAARALLGVYFGIALENQLDPVEADAAELAAQLTRLFAPGVARRHRTEVPGHGVPRRAVPDFRLPLEPGPPPTDRLPRAERREQVLTAARAVFLETGAAGSRSREIAQRAGITERFLFRLFESKDQMFREAVQVPVERGFAELADAVQDALDGPGSRTELVDRFNELGLSFFAGYGPVCALALFSELAEGRRFYRRELGPHLRRIREAVVARLGGQPDIDPEIARRALIGPQWAVAFDASASGGESGVGELARRLTTLFTTGIRRDG